MKVITIDDQTRNYLEAKGLFVKEVTKGNATALKALPATTTNLPDPIVSTILQKTRGGSGTETAEIRLSDSVTTTVADVSRLHELGIALHFSQRPASPDGAGHMLKMLQGLVASLAASDGQWLKEILAGMHAE